jgi:predicted regulator of Ras-like GTPase activity (Roadblock/LC7/MglB family)
MENILKNIAILRGVHHVCIYQEGKEPVSNFPVDAHEAMALSHDLIDQIFSALKAIDKSHNEIYFSIGDKFLVGYLLGETCIVLLLTDKKINFPLLNMGIKSAAMKVKRIIKEQEKQKIVPQMLAPTPIARRDSVQSIAPDSELQEVLDKLLNILKQYLGPAAIFIFEDEVAKWNKTYVQNRENLPHLVDIIKKGLDPNKEQADFLKQAQVVIGDKI